MVYRVIVLVGFNAGSAHGTLKTAEERRGKLKEKKLGVYWAGIKKRVAQRKVTPVHLDQLKMSFSINLMFAYRLK